MTDHRVTAVVLTYNRVTEVIRTVGHLAALLEQPAIIVVDNGSQDGTSALLTKSFPEITVLRLEQNIGAAARNVGVQEAATPYVALCDDDTWWAADGSISNQAAFLNNGRPIIRYPLISSRMPSSRLRFASNPASRSRWFETT